MGTKTMRTPDEGEDIWSLGACLPYQVSHAPHWASDTEDDGYMGGTSLLQRTTIIMQSKSKLIRMNWKLFNKQNYGNKLKKRSVTF